MHPTSTPTLIACGGLLAAAALLSGCGGGSTTQAVSTPPPATTTSAPPSPVVSSPVVPAPVATAPVVTPAPARSAAAPAPAHSTAAGPAPCLTAHLGITVRPDAGGGAAGSTYESVVLVNQGSTTCTLSGHPGVSYVAGRTGAQVGAPAGRDGVPALVTLVPGGSAHAALRVVNYQDIDRETCQASPVEGLRIYPPDQTASAFVAAPGSTCADPSVVLLTVGPVQLGV